MDETGRFRAGLARNKSNAEPTCSRSGRTELETSLTSNLEPVRNEPVP